MSNQLREVTNSKYLSAYASWSSALDAIGSTPTVLRVNESPTISANRTLPNNVHLQFEGQSVLNSSSGVIVNGPPPQDMPLRQIFAGDGQYRIKANHPAARELHGIWWLPDATASAHVITTAQREAMYESQNGNYGSRLILPQGKFRTAVPFQIRQGSLEGHFAYPQPGVAGPFPGTILELTVSGSPVRVMQGARMVYIKNITLYADDAIANSQAILMQGGAGEVNINGVYIDNVVTYGFEDAVKCYSVTGDYEFDNIVARPNCHLLNYSRSGFFVNSVNGKYDIPANIFLGKANGQTYHIYAPRYGTGHSGGHARGTHTSSIAPADTHRETQQIASLAPSAFNASTGVINWPSHGLQNGDSIKMNRTSDGLGIPAATSTNLPVLSDSYGLIDLTQGAKTYAYVVDADNIKLGRNPDAARNGDPFLFDIDVAPGENIGLYSERPNVVVANQRQRGFICLGSAGTSGGWTIDNYQDEGLPEFIRVANPESLPVNADYHSYPPIRVNGGYTVGQIFLERACELTLNDVTLPIDSIHDEYDVKARVRIKGCVPTFVGVGGAAYSRAGFFSPKPWRFDDFKGSSVVPTGDNLDNPFTVAGIENDKLLFKAKVENNAAPIELFTGLLRLGSGIKAAFFKWVNNYKLTPATHGGNDRLAGTFFEQHLAYEGALLNSKPPTAATVGTGTFTLDLAKNDRFILDNPAQNGTIEIANAWTDGSLDLHTQRVTLFIKTGSTTSRDLTSGTNVVLSGTFATGTTDGAYYVIFFDFEPINNKLIEVARSKITAAIPDPLSVKNLVIAADTNSAIQWLGRDGSGSIYGYCPTANTLIIFTGSGLTAFSVDGNTSAGNTPLSVSEAGSALKRISTGAADSAGAGFKLLRIPN